MHGIVDRRSDEVQAKIQDRCEVAVICASRSAKLAFGQLRGFVSVTAQHLQCDALSTMGVERLEDDTHAAAANSAQELETTQRYPSCAAE